MDNYYEEKLKLNALLQQKKSNIRQTIRDLGILPRKGANAFDKYKYFSEAQYKELFTKLLADEALELSASVEAVTPYKATEKQPYGRLAEVIFTLSDIDTGYAEQSKIIGDGMDKGDKGIYKAYTGALKYYLANTFMVATGDDPEVPDKAVEKKITDRKAKILERYIEEAGVEVEIILEAYEHKKLTDFTEGEYANCLKRLEATKKDKEGNV